MRKLALVFVLAVSSIFAQGACSRTDVVPAHPAVDAGTPIDLDVMAFLSEARSLHHDANLREASNDDKGAIISLEKLTKAARPHPDKTIPEVEDVLADTYARTAEIRLRDGDIDGAARDVKEGTTHAQADTYFHGHLLEVGGIIEEARAASLTDAGKTTEADAAKKRALDFLHRAVEIQDQVIRASLSPDGGAL
ncbi:MAG: hypothetical protein ABI183_08150 [Polyangiaceae bacterium]